MSKYGILNSNKFVHKSDFSSVCVCFFSILMHLKHPLKKKKQKMNIKRWLLCARFKRYFWRLVNTLFTIPPLWDVGIGRVGMFVDLWLSVLVKIRCLRIIMPVSRYDSQFYVTRNVVAEFIDVRTHAALRHTRGNANKMATRAIKSIVRVHIGNWRKCVSDMYNINSIDDRLCIRSDTQT